MPKAFEHKYKKYRVVAGIVAVSCLSVAGSQAAFAANEEIDIYDSTAIIGDIAPELMSQTAPIEDAPLQVEEESDEGGSRITLDASTKAVERGITETSSVSAPLTLTAEYMTQKVGESSGIAVWETKWEDVAAYVQPMNTGLRIFTAIASPSAPTEYAYELDVPPGTELKENSLGYMILDPLGNSLGQLHTPWAEDSSGNDISTHYEWTGETLTQIVDLSDAGIDFPVLIDPAWTYTHTVNIDSVTPAQIRAKLLNCFNCYFPVEGAPASYPSFNQYLPLVVRPFVGSPIWWDFSCYMDMTGFETLGNLSYFRYSFRASSTHVDGAGSTIAFDFNPRWTETDPTVRSQLVVSAYIMNDDPAGVGQPLYTTAAIVTWNTFAANLNAS